MVIKFKIKYFRVKSDILNVLFAQKIDHLKHKTSYEFSRNFIINQIFLAVIVITNVTQLVILKSIKNA